MSAELDTYSPNWQSNLHKVSEKLNKLYNSNTTADGLRTSNEILTNQFLRMRQGELRTEEHHAYLAQFKTLDDCIQHYTNELYIEVTDLMSEYVSNNGNMKDEEQRMNDRLFAALRGEDADESKPRQLPETIQKLSIIRVSPSLETAEDVYNQFTAQYSRLEGDFIIAMGNDSIRDSNVTLLNNNKVETVIANSPPEHP